MLALTHFMMNSLNDIQKSAIRTVLDRIQYLHHPSRSALNHTKYDEESIIAMKTYFPQFPFPAKRGLFEYAEKLFANINPKIRKALAQEYFLNKEVEEIVNEALNFYDDEEESDDDDMSDYGSDYENRENLPANLAVAHFNTISVLLGDDCYDYQAEGNEEFMNEFKEHWEEIKNALT